MCEWKCIIIMNYQICYCTNAILFSITSNCDGSINSSSGSLIVYCEPEYRSESLGQSLLKEAFNCPLVNCIMGYYYYYYYLILRIILALAEEAAIDLVSKLYPLYKPALSLTHYHGVTPVTHWFIMHNLIMASHPTFLCSG